MYFSCLYINPKRALGFTRDVILKQYLARVDRFRDLSPDGIVRGSVVNAFERAIWTQLSQSPVPTLTEVTAEGPPAVGTVFVHRAMFWCKGVPQAKRRKGQGLAEIRTELPPQDAAPRTLFVPFSIIDLTSNSASVFLSGRRDLVLLAAVSDSQSTRIEATPIAFGQIEINPLDGREEADLWYDWRNRLYVAAERLDSFKAMRSVPPPELPELEVLRNIPEVQVKHAVAEIIGEPYVGKDWGGESSDLFSARIELSGKRIPTAFIFKGPAKFRPMTLAELGKNGDQLVRAFREPVELVVIQHCHQITAPVWEMAQALASRPGLLKRFTMLDGAETLRLLRAYQKCGQ